MNAKLWAGNTEAKTLADKLELISRGLTQTINDITGEIKDMPIRRAFENRLEYERKKKRESMGLTAKNKGK